MKASQVLQVGKILVVVALLGMTVKTWLEPSKTVIVQVPTLTTDLSVSGQSEVKPVVNFETMKPCDQLDAIVLSGKSVSSFLDAAVDTQFKTYQDAINSSCVWHKDQLQTALNLWQARQPKTIVQPIIVETVRVEKPQTGSAVIAQSNQNVTEWQQQQMKKRASEKLSAGERCAWGGSQKDCNEFNRKSR